MSHSAYYHLHRIGEKVLTPLSMDVILSGLYRFVPPLQGEGVDPNPVWGGGGGCIPCPVDGQCQASVLWLHS